MPPIPCGTTLVRLARRKEIILEGACAGYQDFRGLLLLFKGAERLHTEIPCRAHILQGNVTHLESEAILCLVLYPS